MCVQCECQSVHEQIFVRSTFKQITQYTMKKTQVYNDLTDKCQDRVMNLLCHAFIKNNYMEGSGSATIK